MCEEHDFIRNMIISLAVIAAFSLFTDANGQSEKTTIVITQDDGDTIKSILEAFKKHQNRVRFRSDIQSYLDCEAHRKLLEFGWKAVPYLIEQVALLEDIDGYIGSALIKYPNIKTLEEVFEYNLNRKAKAKNTLIFFSLEILLEELVSRRTLDKNSYQYDGIFTWLDWWQQHKHKFIFQTKQPIVIHSAKYFHSTTPQIRTTTKNGLLDIYAISATYRQIIERAAAEMNVDIFIGEQRYIDVITRVRMKKVTFEEFLYIIGRQAYVKGFDYRKTEKGYWIGGKEPAEPRPILHGWGIMMEKTVFSVGDEIPVTIIARLPGPIIDPNDSVFPCYGSFRVTTNDGKIIKDYNPVTKPKATTPPIRMVKDGHHIQVLLNKFCKLTEGEYNIRFRYLDNETPSVAIELYDRKVK